MTDPVISVILPVYNGGSYLRESVESVLNQSFPNFEFLILDDCSSDGSLQFIKDCTDKRIVVFENRTNKGLFYNVNFLINRSRGSLIKLWSQDDKMNQDCLKTIIAFHCRNPFIGFSYCGRDIIDEMGTIIPLNNVDTTPEIINRQLHSRIAFFTGSIAGNIANVTLVRAVQEEVGPFDESMKISADFDMWVRIAEKYCIGFIKEHLVQLRNHPQQLSRQPNSYINHFLEDIRVYQRLLSYVNESEKKQGKKLLRNHKLLFYYTLMIKAFMKGSFKSGLIYFKRLRKLESILILSYYFIKNRILFKKSYTNMHLNNSELIS
jgi:glycosyltransferase involved in cell wall biosynthesis